MRQMYLVGLVLLAVACNAHSQEEILPTITPTTPPFLLNYQGPLLGNQAEQSTACTTESGCTMQIAPDPQSLDTSVRPLIPHRIGDFEIGLPDGYSPLVLEDEILITATEAGTLGGFVFSIHTPSPPDLEALLLRLDNPDFEAGLLIENATWQGRLVEIRDGAVARLESPHAPTLFIEAFTQAGYWAAFEATFLAMLKSLSLS